VTFAVSAVVHEYVFGVSLGRVQGYQTLFFLLQGLGVAATVRLQRRVWPLDWGDVDFQSRHEFAFLRERERRVSILLSWSAENGWRDGNRCPE
jgi:hypothetical protein